MATALPSSKVMNINLNSPWIRSAVAPSGRLPYPKLDQMILLAGVAGTKVPCKLTFA